MLPGKLPNGLTIFKFGPVRWLFFVFVNNKRNYLHIEGNHVRLRLSNTKYKHYYPHENIKWSPLMLDPNPFISDSHIFLLQW